MQPKFQCTLKRRNANLLQLETGHLQLIAQQRHPGFPIQSLRRLFPACRGTAQSQSLHQLRPLGIHHIAVLRTHRGRSQKTQPQSFSGKKSLAAPLQILRRQSLHLPHLQSQRTLFLTAEKWPTSLLQNTRRQFLHRFFLRGKAGNAGLVRVKPELRRLVEFLNVNLIRDDWPFRDPFDVVFCRNVIIYFERAVQELILGRICRYVRPGGWLILGHSETLTGMDLPLRSVAPTIYSRA